MGTFDFAVVFSFKTETQLTRSCPHRKKGFFFTKDYPTSNHNLLLKMFGKFHYIISGFLFKKKVLHFVYELRVQIFIEQKIVELQKTKKCILYRHSITKKILWTKCIIHITFGCNKKSLNWFFTYFTEQSAHVKFKIL